MPRETVYTCEVCSSPAKCRHFGVISCESCSTFFRRAVTTKTAYVCKRKQSCPTTKVPGKQRCRYCRFQRCMALGMDVSACASIREATAQTSENAILFKSIDAYKTSFMVRAKTHNASGITQVEEGEFATHSSMTRATRCEVHVLHYYIRSCGLVDHLPTGRLSEESMKALIAEFFPIWFAFETSANTARHRGHLHRRLYFVDGKVQLVNEAAYLNLLRASGVTLFPEVVARHALDYAEERLSLAQKIESSAMDEVEHATLLQLLIAKAAVHVKAIDSQTASAYTEKVLRHLHEHSKDTYADSVTRSGNILLMLHDVENVRYWYDQHVTMIGLGGRDIAAELQAAFEV